MTTKTPYITLCAALGLFDGCATSSPATSTPAYSASVETQRTSQMSAADRMFYWREEARELHEMAKHREREADLVLTRKPGPATSEVVKRMRLFAKQLHAAAEYADGQVQEAEQEVLLGMIQ